MDDERFSMLAEVMRDDGEVIKEIDLAKDGIISQVYPSEKNEVWGLTCLNMREAVKMQK